MGKLVRASDFRVTGWDRFILRLFPGWGRRRLQARAAAFSLQRHFDATASSHRTAHWQRRSTDANAAAAASLVQLRELSRDLRRNNGWARRGIGVIATNTVGRGIQPKPVGAGLGEDQKREALELWNAWGQDVACDFDGRLPFSGLQDLVMQTVVESGECLVCREPTNSAEGLAIPLRIRVLEPDYLDVARDGQLDNGGQVIAGVEFDQRGRRVAYWLYEDHPGGRMRMSTRFASRRVAAADVLHIYRVERPGQVRGIPWLCAAIAKLHDFDDYDDARLMQAKIAACFAAFVTDVDGDSKPLGEEDPDNAKLEELQPGHISYLAGGRDVTVATPPSTGDHSGFTETQLRRIAVSLDVTYEDLTADYSRVNFSSARMARLSHYGSVHKWRHHMLIPQFCAGVWRWAMQLASAVHGWRATPSALWQPPPLPFLEPDKEGLAYQRLIRTGVMSAPDAIRERGNDPQQQLDEIAAWNKQLDELGIVLDSDPRRTSSTGQAQGAGAAGAAGGSDTDDEKTADDATPSGDE